MAPDKPFAVSGGTLKEIAQGLLEMKKMARSIENSAEAFLPLCSDVGAQPMLAVAGLARSISQDVSMLYNQIAREALS